MELDQLLRQRVLCSYMLIDIACINLNRILALTDDFLELFILLGQPLNIAINDGQTFFEVVDLVVEDFVMSVHCNLTVD